MTVIKEVEARPFIKWVGGKTQLLAQFEPYLPRDLANGTIRRYVEPFLGGGAMFFHVAQHYDIQEAYLSDINPELILVYRVVRDYAANLIFELERHQEEYDELDEADRAAYFYAVRSIYNAQRHIVDFKTPSAHWVTRAAFMIFLNKTCFNGLYRLNKKGEFNAPHGSYRNPAICDADNLALASRLLQRAWIKVAPFEACEGLVGDDTFVYFDPPYRPLSATSNFTSYSKQKFDDTDQMRLAYFFRGLDDTTDASLMLSNSDTEDGFFERLYPDFVQYRVWANRAINSNGSKRGKIAEIVVTNY